MSDGAAGFFFIVIAALVIMGCVHIGTLLEKYDCQKHLPRDVECTWQPPSPGEFEQG